MNIEEGVREILRRHTSSGDLPSDLPLGATGLGLDSIAMIEVLLACEERFGVAFAEDFVADESLTIGGLTDHVRALAAS